MSVQRTVFGPSYPAIFSQKRPHILSVGWNIVKMLGLQRKEKMAVQWAKLFTKLCLCVTLSLMSVILLSFSFPSIFNVSHRIFDEIYPTGVIIIQGISGLGLVYLFYSWRKMETGFRFIYASVNHVPESEKTLLKISQFVWYNTQQRSKESWKLKKHGGQMDDFGIDEIPMVHSYHGAPKC